MIIVLFQYFQRPKRKRPDEEIYCPQELQLRERGFLDFFFPFSSRVSSFFSFFLLRAAARAANISPSLLQFIHALSPAIIHQKRINAGAVRLHPGIGSVRPRYR